MNIIVLLLAVIIGIALIILIIYLLRKHENMGRSLDMIFLKITLPKKESKEDKETDSEAFSSSKDFKEVIGLMEHLLNALHSIYSSDVKYRIIGQDFFSLEYATQEGRLIYYVVIPYYLRNIVERQITSFYTDAIIEETIDYNIFNKGSKLSGCYLIYNKHYKYPIRTYQQLKSDPLNNIANAFSKIKKEEGAAIQIILRPIKNGWQKKCSREAEKVYNTKKSLNPFLNPLRWLNTILNAIVQGPTPETIQEYSEDKASGQKTTPIVEEQVKAIDAKSNSIGYAVSIRIIASAPTKREAVAQMKNLRSSFAQFADNKNNSLKYTKYHNIRALIKKYIFRDVRQSLIKRIRSPKMIMSSEEIASLYHFPNIKYNKSPNIAWQRFKIAPAPENLPEEGILLGHNVYRGEKKAVYLKNDDRFRHFYCIGQTGTGKTSIIQVMARQDFKNGKGCCIIDPHGQLIEDLLPYIPRSRADDVILFDPADVDRPIGINMLEAKTEEEKDLIALDAMNMMIKLFGNEIFGPRIQDYFRNGCLTLMADKEEGGALTDLVRLFTDDEWQKYKLKKVKNPIVRSFWEKQMAKTGLREKQEMIPYFAAKFGQFTTNTMMRNIIGQTHSSFDFGDAMNSGKIVLMNLSKGLTGDINSELLGLIVVNKLQVGAMRRQTLKEEDRRDFFLYVDEFQNYVTDSIGSILSEARKYRLGLVLAHQYLDQLKKEGKYEGKTDLQGAIFGNVGTIMCYKIGAQDAEYMAKEMAPVFSDQDLVNQDKFKASIKLSIDFQPSRPFSIIPINPYASIHEPDFEAAEAYKQLSRLKYGREKEFVTREILRRIGA